MMQSKSILIVSLILTLFSNVLCIQDDEEIANDNGNYVDVHQHPRSGFSCAGKKSGEYYADLTTNCQLYYVCLPNAQLVLSPTSFACPNTTRFNQATRVCSPADQVYCRIAERYYENIHGNIDSKDHSPNEYLGADFDKTPWQINRPKSKSLIVPLTLDRGEPEYKIQPAPERPRPAPRALPKVETSSNLNNLNPKSDSPLHTSFSLAFNNPQNPRVVARTRASTSTTTNSRRGNSLDLLSNINSQPSSSNRFKPAINNQNSRSRIINNSRTVIINQQPTTTTTTTTTTTAAPITESNAQPPKPNNNAEYVYDYVEYDQPAPNQPNSNAQPVNKPPPSLPALPALEDAAPSLNPNRNTNAVSTSNTNLGALFSSSISHQPISNSQTPPRISGPSSLSSSSLNAQRPPQRNLPQTNSLNYFNSNPFASNPFNSNPFSGNSGSVRQKRENKEEEIKMKKQPSREEDEFSCHDKLPGLGYADISSNCRMYHICLPTTSKGKFKDYTLFCESNTAYNQYLAICEPLDKFDFDCKRSTDFYLYNKQVNLDGYLKNRFRISKQLADIKPN